MSVLTTRAPRRALLPSTPTYRIALHVAEFRDHTLTSTPHPHLALAHIFTRISPPSSRLFYVHAFLASYMLFTHLLVFDISATIRSRISFTRHTPECPAAAPRRSHSVLQDTSHIPLILNRLSSPPSHRFRPRVAREHGRHVQHRILNDRPSPALVGPAILGAFDPFAPISVCCVLVFSPSLGQGRLHWKFRAHCEGRNKHR